MRCSRVLQYITYPAVRKICQPVSSHNLEDHILGEDQEESDTQEDTSIAVKTVKSTESTTEGTILFSFLFFI